jgi:hypothetical protein
MKRLTFVINEYASVLVPSKSPAKSNVCELGRSLLE